MGNFSHEILNTNTICTQQMIKKVNVKNVYIFRMFLTVFFFFLSFNALSMFLFSVKIYISRAQSVRRTSLRDKTLTTKKDAVEETRLRLRAQEVSQLSQYFVVVDAPFFLNYQKIFSCVAVNA